MNITISIVSHNHCNLVNNLLEDLVKCTNINKIIVTHNIGFENIKIPVSINDKVITVINKFPKGFAANHNQVFKKYCKSDYFIVLNPDVRIYNNPFPRLLTTIKETGCNICAPRILNSNGKIEDSFRYFPTPLSLILKLFGFDITIYPQDGSSNLIKPDWVAGMFMFINSSWFKKNLFDENYFLYYEDIDLCLRCWKSGSFILVDTKVEVVHDARRDSHKKLFFLYLHFRSICYFLFKHYLRFPR